jgi:hypothetical protein
VRVTLRTDRDRTGLGQSRGGPRKDSNDKRHNLPIREIPSWNEEFFLLGFNRPGQTVVIQLFENFSNDRLIRLDRIGLDSLACRMAGPVGSRR